VDSAEIIVQRGGRALAWKIGRRVFASLYIQPLEAAAIRALIQDRLTLPRVSQMLLQLGLARTSRSSARRPPTELTERGHQTASRRNGPVWS